MSNNFRNYLMRSITTAPIHAALGRFTVVTHNPIDEAEETLAEGSDETSVR